MKTALAVALFVVMLAVTAMPATAGEISVSDVITAAGIIRDLSQRSGGGVYSPHETATSVQAPAHSFRVEWAQPSVVDASGGYGDGWGRYSASVDAIRSAMTNAGKTAGILVLPDDVQARQTQSRTAQPGYDPRYAPRQGLLQGPQGQISVTVNFSGYNCREEFRINDRNANGRWMQEQYKLRIQVAVTSGETLLPVATATAEGSSSGRFFEGEMRRGGIDIGGLLSKRARPDRAVEQAAYAAMRDLAVQLLSGCLTGSVAEVVIAGVNGPQVVITTTDGSDIRDSGVVEGFTYAVRGPGIINPVTGQPTRGTIKLCAVRVVSIDRDIAQALIVADDVGNATTIGAVLKVKDRVTLEPYQSLQKPDGRQSS